jgi:fido (protein-threonine AMPylation protein)
MTDESTLERQLREAAMAAAESTFEQFRESSDSDYYEAPGRTPVETWQEIRARVGLVAAEAVELALHDSILTPSLLSDWHRRIFESTFPVDAGRLRDGRDTVTYGHLVGPRDRVLNRTGRGTRARALPSRLRKICEEFNRTAADLQDAEAPRLIDVTYPAARLYAKLLPAHPWSDGNGRTSYVVLQFALVRLGTLSVSLPDYTEQQWRLGRALRTGGGQSYEPLATYLAERIRAVEADGLQSQEP